MNKTKMRRIEYSDGTSNQFGEIEQVGPNLHSRWGRIGTLGQSRTKTFSDSTTCAAAMAKLIRDKIRQGYVEVDVDAAEKDALQAEAQVQVASASDIPRVLTDPPWLHARKTVAAVAVEPLHLDPVERWESNAREQALSLPQWQKKRFGKAVADPAAMAKELGFHGHFSSLEIAEKAIFAQDADMLITTWRGFKGSLRHDLLDVYALAHLPETLGIKVWNTLAEDDLCGYLGRSYLLAHYGLRALPGFIALVRHHPTENLDHVQYMGAVELAVPMARAFAKIKTLRHVGRNWLLRFPEHAMCGLIAPAIGKVGEDRTYAVSVLRFLHSQGHQALLQQVADRYQNSVVTAALCAVLEEDPLDRFPAKLGKLHKFPHFWQPLRWRRPILNESAGASAGMLLPRSALEHIGTMLTFPTTDGVYAGVTQIKAACTAESLAEFGWDCFSAWLSSGAPSKEIWAMMALGWFGTDDIARRLTPYIRTWPGESAHARAVAGLDVLANIGTDVALMLLNGIAQKVKFKGLQDKAREKIDQIAQARNLTTEELEDRLAPDLGLDQHGTLVLDFGPRYFRLGFDETLKPFVRDSEGARLADLPKPKKTDDEVKAKEAVERFKALKKDARTVASQQVLRLEIAMCARRRWRLGVFQQFLAQHPLVRHLVQRIVWGIYEMSDENDCGGNLKACFRVAEDGSYTDGNDDTFEVVGGDNIRIGMPHALEMPMDNAQRFGQLFADYELLQPFPQIGRDTYTLTPDEQALNVLERWKGVVVPTGQILGLANKGWRRGEAQDGGIICYFTKALGQERVVELTFEPGFFVGSVDEYPEQTLHAVRVGKPAAWGGIQNPERFASLDPISVSELILDMEKLRA